jgi:hypothetical protein
MTSMPTEDTDEQQILKATPPPSKTITSRGSNDVATVVCVFVCVRVCVCVCVLQRLWSHIGGVQLFKKRRS